MLLCSLRTIGKIRTNAAKEMLQRCWSQQTSGLHHRATCRNKLETDCWGWKWWWEFYNFTVVCEPFWSPSWQDSHRAPHPRRRERSCFNIGPDARQFLYCLHLGVHQCTARERLGFTRSCSVDLTRLSAHSFRESEMKAEEKILGWAAWGAD